MNKHLVLKTVGVWLLFMVLAILNGMLRVKVLSPLLGRTPALMLSGILLAAVIFLATYLLVPKFKVSHSKQYWMIGALWVLFTLAFEFLFGHYVIGESWRSLLSAYNVATGNLWLLVVFSILFSPYFASRLRARRAGGH